MRTTATLVTLLLCGWLGGCASAPADAPVEHLLRPPLEETGAAMAQPPAAALGRLSIPPYLDRDGIVLETGDNRIQVARGHRWAEPLPRAVRRTLQVGISRSLGRGVAASPRRAADAAVLIDVDIHQLHGSQEGRVVLAADWQLREPRTGRVLERHELVRSALTREAGYDALVQAHGQLLMELSRAISGSLDNE